MLRSASDNKSRAQAQRFLALEAASDALGAAIRGVACGLVLSAIVVVGSCEPVPIDAAYVPATWSHAARASDERLTPASTDSVSGEESEVSEVELPQIELPQIERIEYEDADGTMAPLADECVWQGRVRMRLLSEKNLRRSEVRARLFDTEEQDAEPLEVLSCDSLVRDEDDAYLANFLLPEGHYRRVEFCVYADRSASLRPSASGAASQKDESDKSDISPCDMEELFELNVDRTDPVVEMELAQSGCVESGCWYGATRAQISVRIRDLNLDFSHSTVAGVSLEEILRAQEQGQGLDVERGKSDEEVAFSEDRPASLHFDGWEQHYDEGYCVEGTLVVGEGYLELADLVEAKDRAQNASDGTLADGEEQLKRLTVDLTAPQLSVCVSREPIRVCEDEQGEQAFFCGETSLVFAFADGSGVRKATLTGAGERDHTLKLRKLSYCATGATIVLGKEPFSDHEYVVVEDLVGNLTRWSLQALGEKWCDGGLTQVDNAPLMLAGGESLVGTDGHPTALVADDEAPELKLSGIMEGSHHRGELSARLMLYDKNLGSLMRFDPQTVVLSVERDGEPLSEVPLSAGTLASDGESCTLDLPFVVRQTHEDDGNYLIRARCQDLSGNLSKEVTLSFVVDTTAPVLRVSFSDEAEQGPYYTHERVAHLTLVERQLTLEDLNAADPLVSVQADACDGRGPDEVELGSWRQGTDAESFERDVVFPPNGTYELRLVGADRAGNLMEGAEGTMVDEEGTYASGSFIIDDEAPQLSCTYASATPRPNVLAGVDYFTRPVTLVFSVRDRNFDPALSTVTNSQGDAQALTWTASQRDAQGEITHTATLVYTQEQLPRAGEKLPQIVAVDLAGNVAKAAGPHFVVDLTAPEVTRVSTSKEPAAVGIDPQDGDPLWFYNEQDGKPACMSFTVEDEYGLEALWLDDPDDAYDEQLSMVRGSPEAQLILTLKDEVTPDTVFERNVVLSARDVAGNLRSWSMDRSGTIVAEYHTGTANVSIDGKGLFPHALVTDATAPVLSISGVLAGSYYNAVQVAHLTMDEFHFGYLCLFDPERCVATVEYRAGNAEGARSTRRIPVSSFTGERPLYAMDVPLTQDGHYRITGQVEDYAGNRSQAVVCDEFTIDTVAPVIQVSWDNNDARNGRYFNARRTATVEVHEHNFDAARMEIATTGSIGQWYSAGDVHYCEVSFASDATLEQPHTLVVRGKDLAGNEAAPFEEAPFVIDTCPPHVSFARRVSDGEDAYELAADVAPLMDETAYAQGFEPQVTLSDEANLDLSSVAVSLVGKRSGTEAMAQGYRTQTQTGEDSVEVRWSNLGLEEGDGGLTYRLDADDVYTLTAQVSDLAGNSSPLESLSFSLNRYGSNFFVDELEGSFAQGEDSGDTGELLATPPQLVVHEVNVCGAEPQEPTAHSVTKEYASATSALELTAEPREAGYTLRATSEASQRNPYEGWSEYLYTIASGNFGQGSSSDYGDGGQGQYRVDVSTRDRAQNNNTTARYWASDAPRVQEAQDSSATVTFTLDEFGPQAAFVDMPGLLRRAKSYTARFTLTDEITNGDSVEVLVDGEPVAVYPAGSDKALEPGQLVDEGSYCFEIGCRPLWETRSIELCVSDYTKLDARRQTLRVEGFHVSTLVWEATYALLALIVACTLALLRRRQKRAR